MHPCYRERVSVMASFERSVQKREIVRLEVLPGGTALEVSIYRKRERGFYLRYILIPRETLGVPMQREANTVRCAKLVTITQSAIDTA